MTLGKAGFEDRPSRDRRRKSARISPLLLALAVLLAFPSASLTTAQAADGPSDPFAAVRPKLEAAARESRELARDLLPSAAALGTDWRTPWQLPEAFAQRAESEAAFWARQAQDLGPLGLSVEDGRNLASYTAQMLDQQLAQEGGRPGDGLKMMLLQSRKEYLPPVQTMLEGLEVGSRLARNAAAMMAEGAESDDNRREEVMRQSIFAPFEGLGHEALAEMVAQDISLLRHRMRMSYYRSNDWTGLVESRLRDEEIKERGLWLITVKIDLMLMTPNPMQWLPDVPAEEIARQKTVAESRFAELTGTHHRQARKKTQEDMEQRRQQLLDDIAEVQALIAEDPDGQFYYDARDRLKDLQDRLAKLPEALQEKLQELDETYAKTQSNIIIDFYTVDIGDYCQVSRLTGISPDELNLEASAYSAWLRNGRAVSRIEIGGANTPAEMLTGIMRSVLSEMDARTAHYGGL